MYMDYEIWGTEGEAEDQRGRAEVQGYIVYRGSRCREGL